MPVRGTALGDADFAAYAERVASARVSMRDGKFIPVPPAEWRAVKAEEQIDALLYLGPPAAMTSRESHEIPPELCVEPGFLETQLKRIEISGVPRFEAERLKQYCTAIARDRAR